MPTAQLKVATCQFAVGHSFTRNARAITQFMTAAKKHRAHIVHFSECALTGYPPFDFPSFTDFDWPALRSTTEGILAHAARLKLWVVLGSCHPLTGPHKPHNSLYLINPTGKIIDRYDKRFCMPRDLDHFTPGNHFVTFTVNRVKCALLTCFDLRFDELYFQLARQRVQLILQSFYNARQPGPSAHTHIMRQIIQCRAASYHFWISMANSSARHSPYPSTFVTPEGRITNSLKPNRPGIMHNTLNAHQDFYLPATPFRSLILNRALNSGKTTTDPRSKNRTSL